MLFASSTQQTRARQITSNSRCFLARNRFRYKKKKNVNVFSYSRTVQTGFVFAGVLNEPCALRVRNDTTRTDVLQLPPNMIIRRRRRPYTDAGLPCPINAFRNRTRRANTYLHTRCSRVRRCTAAYTRIYMYILLISFLFVLDAR